jgi:hypothetical protein
MTLAVCGPGARRRQDAFFPLAVKGKNDVARTKLLQFMLRAEKILLLSPPTGQKPFGTARKSCNFDDRGLRRCSIKFCV